MGRGEKSTALLFNDLPYKNNQKPSSLRGYFVLLHG